MKAAALLAALLLSACAAISPRNPVPADLVEQARPYGQPGLRAWADVSYPKQRARAREAWREALVRKRAREGDPLSVDILALSGGGPAGAFAAGLLSGWSDEGTRPKFDLVTGISVGALIAPFAFVGPEYDETLKQLFTEEVATSAPVFAPLAALGGALGLVDTTPFREAIERHVDRNLLDRVADAYVSEDRTLLVGTTNIDAGRPVIWDLGAIAAAGDLALFRQVMLASASIPGVFPPVAIAVQAKGGRYDEFHVDGGVTHSVIVWPNGYERALAPFDDIPLKTTIYVVQNNSLTRPYQPVAASLPALAGRALSTMILVQSDDDLAGIARAAAEAGAEFRLAYVPAALDIASTTDFDREAMRRLYEAAYADARDGIDWKTRPPNRCGATSAPDGC